MILLKGQVLCYPGVRVTVQIVLQSQKEGFSGDAADAAGALQPPTSSALQVVVSLLGFFFLFFLFSCFTLFYSCTLTNTVKSSFAMDACVDHNLHFYSAFSLGLVSRIISLNFLRII